MILEYGLEDVENLQDQKKDVVRARYLRVVSSVSFSELFSYMVKLPIAEHWRPEVKAVKKNEIKKILDYDIFDEIEDVGQEAIGSRWVITVKEKHDGQKQQTKARLFARGFQESLKPQSDSPRASKKSFKLMMAIADNSSFKLAPQDIRAVFLQLKALD